MPKPNLKEPATLKKLAALPFYGMAEAAVRTVDPLWKVILPAVFIVKMERENVIEGETCPHCGSDEGEWSETETQTVKVEAVSEEDARKTAEFENPDWYVKRVEFPKPMSSLVPPEYLN